MNTLEAALRSHAETCAQTLTQLVLASNLVELQQFFKGTQVLPKKEGPINVSKKTNFADNVKHPLKKQMKAVAKVKSVEHSTANKKFIQLHFDMKKRMYFTAINGVVQRRGKRERDVRYYSVRDGYTPSSKVLPATFPK